MSLKNTLQNIFKQDADTRIEIIKMKKDLKHEIIQSTKDLNEKTGFAERIYWILNDFK